MKQILDKISDMVTDFIGSWYFITLFFVSFLSWILLNNSVLKVDPYPYILLNLVLSTLAAVQGAIIMMSQKRQDIKDREHMKEIYRIVKKCEEYVEKVDKLSD